MAFSIFLAGRFTRASGVLARLKSLSEAEAVVLSFVRRLRMQEINTINGLQDVLEICMTAKHFINKKGGVVKRRLYNYSRTGLHHSFHAAHSHSRMHSAVTAFFVPRLFNNQCLSGQHKPCNGRSVLERISCNLCRVNYP